MRTKQERGPQLKRWWFCARWQRDYFSRSWGWRELDIAIIKPHTEPEMGERWTHGKHYRGVWFRLAVWLPWEVSQWR